MSCALSLDGSELSAGAATGVSTAGAVSTAGVATGAGVSTAGAGALEAQAVTTKIQQTQKVLVVYCGFALRASH